MSGNIDMVTFPDKNQWSQLLFHLELWGADPKAAIEIMDNDESFYFKILLKFVQKREWDSLEAALQRHLYSDAFKIAHDLKGVTATLSLTPLRDAVSKIVEDLRGDPLPELDEDLLIFRLELSRLQKIIRCFSPSNAKP